MTKYTIALPALMGHLREPQSYARACAYLRGLGHTLIEDPNVYSKSGFFSASDEARLTAFHAMLWQKPDIVMPVRGGYGITRLLPHFDWSLIRTCGAKFVGFSDFTGFNLAAMQHGVMTFSGPLAAPDFGREEVNTFAETEFWRTIGLGKCSVTVARAVDQSAPQVHDQVVNGTLWGTNLSLIAHLVGTPFFPKVSNGILLVEDIGEEPYAIDRMLMQLFHAGILQQQKAIIFGAINGFDLASVSAASYTMEELIADLRHRYDGLVLSGFPFGHIAEKATLPIGGPSRLTVRPGEYLLEAQH